MIEESRIQSLNKNLPKKSVLAKIAAYLNLTMLVGSQRTTRLIKLRLFSLAETVLPIADQATTAIAQTAQGLELLPNIPDNCWSLADRS